MFACLHSKTSKLLNKFSTLVLSPAQKRSVFMGVSHWRLGKSPLLWVDLLDVKSSRNRM